jgi:hypothetical protein
MIGSLQHKILGNRKKLRRPQVFNYYLAISIRKNYTRVASCHLQSTEEGLSEGKDMNMRCFLNNLLINLFIKEKSTFYTHSY